MGLPGLLLGLSLVIVGATQQRAESADASGAFKSFGSGHLSCERWVLDRLEGNPSAGQSEMWIAGYLSAYNQFVHRGQDVTQPYDGTFVLTWLDEYCRKRPDHQLGIAARELLTMLRRRQ